MSGRGNPKGTNRHVVLGLSARFWRHVQRRDQDSCWEWTASTFKSGYGQFKVNKISHNAHRVAWELSYGPIPDGMFICHHCDNPLCCNPSHLFVGSPQANMDDMRGKGRESKGTDFPAARLDDEAVLEITRLAKSGMLQRDIGKLFGVGQTAIGDVLRNVAWKHVKRETINRHRNSSGEHNGRARLTEKDVRDILVLHGLGVETKEIHAAYPIHLTSLQRVISGRSWVNVPRPIMEAGWQT
jgi:hypothetical protein